MQTSLIIPAFNEEKAISLVIEEALDYVDEIIVVDDGSKDRTYEIACRCAEKYFKVKVFRHQKNFGKVAAIRTGVNNASGEFIILTDADYTYPAQYIPLFIERLKKDADLVLGNRISLSKGNIPMFNRLGNIIFSSLTSFVACVEIKDGQTGFRAFRSSLFKDIDVRARSLEYETKMTVRAAKLGYNIVEAPIKYRKRIGKSKLRPIRDGYRMLRSLVSIAIKETSTVARAIIFPSAVFFIMGVIFGGITLKEALYTYLFGIQGKHPFYSIFSAFLIILAMQFASFGLLLDHLTKKIDRISRKK